jgi:acyl carrier protein phosphodiesterase
VNFLAHFHIAWPDEGLVAGALEGDFHKGAVSADIEPGVAEGIRLHRSIDAFTDSHPLIAQLREQFPQHLRRYAGILIDLGFDHYLSLHWHRYSTLPLQDFSAAVHRVLERRQDHLSHDSRSMQELLRRHDVLNRYHDWSMVVATAGRIGERFSRGNPLLDIDTELAPLRGALESAFTAFYPEVLRLRPAGVAAGYGDAYSRSPTLTVKDASDDTVGR